MPKASGHHMPIGVSVPPDKTQSPLAAYRHSSKGERCFGCVGAADALREDVVRSAWYEAFRADMRSSLIVRAVENSISGVGSATVWTTSRLASASQRFMYALLVVLWFSHILHVMCW